MAKALILTVVRDGFGGWVSIKLKGRYLTGVCYRKFSHISGIKIKSGESAKFKIVRVK